MSTHRTPWPASPTAHKDDERRAWCAAVGTATLAAVAAATGISVKALRSHDRHHRLTLGRMLVVVALRTRGFSYTEIGDVIDRYHARAIRLWRQAQADGGYRRLYREFGEVDIAALSKVGPVALDEPPPDLENAHKAREAALRDAQAWAAYCKREYMFPAPQITTPPHGATWVQP